MAHELDMTNDRANMAFTGDRKDIWHGLGQELEEGASIESWIEAAGLDWEVKPAEVSYVIPGAAPTFMPTVKGLPDRKVLYRSDNQEALSVVGKDFKVVQPKEVVEFFRDLVEQHDMKLSTAGSLFGGRKFWALAELGKDFEVLDGDKVNGHLLLTTAVDGSLRTTGKFVSTRVVCNNTLDISLGEKQKSVVQVSHRSEWDPSKVKVDLGLIDASWFKFMNDMKTLAAKKATDKQAYTFYTDLLYSDREEPLTKLQERKVDTLMDLYKGGQGADMSYGSYWGILNAVTEQATHGSGKRDVSHQFWDSYYGNQAKMKDLAYKTALAA